MVSALVIVGVVVAVFVGFNVGGSSTGVAFAPAVGSRLVRKFTAGILFTVFAFAGAWIVARTVIDTRSGGIVPAAAFSPVAAVCVLFFTGAALLVSTLYDVPASTSMTAVGAIVGLALAIGTRNEGQSTPEFPRRTDAPSLLLPSTGRPSESGRRLGDRSPVPRPSKPTSLTGSVPWYRA